MRQKQEQSDRTRVTRERILDAATAVVNRVGFSGATIDAIVKESSISKGGIFYHFKNKDECLAAILDRVFDRILHDARKLYAQMPASPGRMLKAYITAWVKWQEPPRNVQIKGIFENPVLLERLIDHRIRHYELVLDDGLPPLTIQKVLLICSGLWSTPLLARATQDELSAFFEIMLREMIQMIDDAAGTLAAGKDAE